MRTFLFMVRRYWPGLLVLALGAVVLLSRELWNRQQSLKGDTPTVAASRFWERYDRTVRQTAVQVIVTRYLYGPIRYAVGYTDSGGAYLARVEYSLAPQEPGLAHSPENQKLVEAVAAARSIIGGKRLVNPGLAYRCAERIIGANVAMTVSVSSAIRAHIEEGASLPALPEPKAFAPAVRDADIESFCTKFVP